MRSSGGVGDPAWRLRPFRRDDEAQLIRSLSVLLDDLYPNGGVWLDRKLREVDEGRAICTLACAGSRVIGCTIETIKDPRRSKLSTVWVAEPERGRGIGTELIKACRNRWVEDRLEKVCVTARLHVARRLAALLVPVGFAFEAVESDRYGPKEDEVVLHWTPIRATASTDPEWVERQIQEIEQKVASAMAARGRADTRTLARID